jgi:hypothetical protein
MAEVINQTPGGTPGTNPTGVTPADNGQGGQAGTGQAPKPTTYDEWLAGQDEATKTLLGTHTQGLRSALDSERTQRKDLERQLRDTAGKLDKDSDARKSLDELANKLASTERQSNFYDEAHRQGANNLKLAYLAASGDGLIDDKGKVDWAQLKSKFPQLFTQPAQASTGQANSQAGGSRSSPANPAGKPSGIEEQIDGQLSAGTRRRWHV